MDELTALSFISTDFEDECATISCARRLLAL
jgi:hypothetical protein